MDPLLAPPLLGAALVFALLGGGRATALARWFDRFLRRPVSLARWLAGLAIVALLVQAATALIAGLPVPHIADEASYLLAADTFVHGRLVNPSHPLWPHFLTYYVLLRPGYASVYMPLQGLVLALGQRLGHPVLGVWLGGALFCVAGSWMLHGWLPPRWARLGSILLCLQLVAGRGWSHSYWGGFMAATAGALLLGAAGRLSRRRPRPRDGATLGLGAGMLALSRPFEGLFTCLAAAAPLALDLLRRAPRRRALLRAALPAIGVLAAVFGWLAYYDWRITGRATTLPVALYDQYSVVPLFLWQPVQAPTAPLPPVMTRFFRDFARGDWDRQQTPAGWARAMATKLHNLWYFYFGVALTPPLLALPWALRRRGPRRGLLVVAAVLASQAVITQSRAHYAAPAACCGIYLVVEGWRHLRLWRPRGVPFGARLAATLPWVVLLLVPGRMMALRPDPDDWQLRRAELRGQLAARPGRQLVLVEYGPAHDPQWDWVVNDADLAGTRVLWARSLGRAADCRLLAFERQRHPWRLLVAEEITPPQLTPIAADGYCRTTATQRQPGPRTARSVPPATTAR